MGVCVMGAGMWVCVDYSFDRAERTDCGGEEAGPPEGAGRHAQRRGQTPPHGGEGRAADPEVSHEREGEMDGLRDG